MADERETRDLVTELRILAELVIDRVEPALRRLDDPEAPHWDGCSWCPLCALAAALRGERHDLLSLVATEFDALAAVVRAYLDDHSSTAASTSARPASPAAQTTDADESGTGGPGASTPSVRPGGYQPITVTTTSQPDRERPTPPTQ
ncbi:hypothetical protein R4172_10400 [Rhodococcus kroppenstedtii]|uniref:Uncharacterized protein n=1 Tax=Rhodococcoides kroppenstedtii TaxID=293050 RepID=A0A1I0SGH7_9NOCA|nr:MULTISPECIES: hypothetical protein [Rhodococcus]AMY18580.1 hypothetical protein A3Q40_01187 [Rhodococcus sp. PBTS 1]MBT1191532.1 hypothetical protein [Rhodococcus kroppenstedtii]MBY6312532.1 hypothetical protein [Rhodococcus kroppenstedtii]MBY6320156.1 hypothetical protein [Rhodococcus kroppenstedtii]MBY6398823.1 hypothetical protein [Rhodococcus kroppenstedtii]